MARIYYIGIDKNIYSLSKSIKSARESAYMFAKLNPDKNISVYDANPANMEYKWERAEHTLGYAYCETKKFNIYWTVMNKFKWQSPMVYRLRKDGTLGNKFEHKSRGYVWDGGLIYTG